MTKNSIQKRTATFAEQKIEISVIGTGGKFYATCNYPTTSPVKGDRLPYGTPGAKTMPARTPLGANEKTVVDSLLDILEKKLGQRPVLSKE